jgi:hypothetical protein
MTVLEKLTAWLRGRNQPASAVAPAIIDGLPAPEGPVVRETAERLRQRDLAAGGWAAEAGALPVESYLSDAHRLVRGVVLGETESGPPAP